jgi:hypothetical protein
MKEGRENRNVYIKLIYKESLLGLYILGNIVATQG